MTEPLGYDTSLSISLSAASSAADHYYQQTQDLDTELRLTQNENHVHRAHYPHGHVDREASGRWHASLDTWDERTGLHRTERHGFASRHDAFVWLEHAWELIA